MKTGINLITKKRQYLIYESFFSKLRISLFLGLVIFFIYIFFVFTLLISKNNYFNKLRYEKNRLEAYLKENSQVEKEFIYFRNKQTQIEDILKTDVNFIPYYNLVRDSLQSATPEPQLDSVIIDKDRSINFTLNFQDSPSLINFLKFAENDSFLHNFDKLLISQFSIIQDRQTTNYKLNLIGKLIPISYEDKN